MVDDMPSRHFVANFCDGNPLIDHQHKAVVKEIAQLVNRIGMVMILCCNYHFRRFLADLFQDFVRSLFK